MFTGESLSDCRSGIVGVEGEMQIASLLIGPGIWEQSVFDSIKGCYKKQLQFSRAVTAVAQMKE